MSGYYDLLDLINKVKKKACCCNGDIGITSLNPPVAAPSTNGATILVNLTTGVGYYWDGDSWEIAFTAAHSGTILESGTYTPVASSLSNLTTVTPSEAQYMRVGSTVTVSGRFTTTQSTAPISCSFMLSLPITTNVGAPEDVSGVAVGQGGVTTQISARVSGSASTDLATVLWYSVDATARTWEFVFTYQVI